MKVVKPENDVNIQMIFDKPYVEVQGELDEVSAIGGGEEMSWEELISIDGSEDEQSDNNEVISENDDDLAQMVATKDTNMDFDFEAFSMSSLQEQGGTTVSEDSDNNEIFIQLNTKI